MNSKDLSILQRLVKIARNQQKIIERLAQAAGDQEYLVRTAQVAAANSGLQASNFSVTFQKGSTEPPVDGITTKIAGTWTVTLSGASKDNKLRQKFMDTLKTQVATQKPDFGPVSIIFAD